MKLSDATPARFLFLLNVDCKNPEHIQGWGNGGRVVPFFAICNHLFFFFVCLFVCFFNYFEELQTVLFEVELIINNAPLVYVYPNTIETCLTSNYLLFGRQLLYCSKTTSSVGRSVTVLSSTIDKINHISNHFLDSWRHEYVVNFRETQRTSKWNINSLKIYVNNIVVDFYETVSRHLRIAIILP